MLDRFRTGVLVQKVTLQNVQPPRRCRRRSTTPSRRPDRGAPEERGAGVRERRDPARPRHRRATARGGAGLPGSVVSKARATPRFRSIVAEYQKAPGVTRDRLYLDMMQSVLGSTEGRRRAEVGQPALPAARQADPAGRRARAVARAGAVPSARAGAAGRRPPPSTQPRASRCAASGRLTPCDSRCRSSPSRRRDPRGLAVGVHRRADAVRDQVPAGRGRRGDRRARPALQAARSFRTSSTSTAAT